MQPTKQTILHDPDNGKHGNCFSAVLASLLHVPIDTVPVFSDVHTWRNDLNKWLRHFGLAYLELIDFDQYESENGIVGCHHEIAGTTSRHGDVLHACVAIDGRVVFDPHPDDAGLKEVQAHGVFIALEPWRMGRP